jgi:hypothetical protein
VRASFAAETTRASQASRLGPLAVARIAVGALFLLRSTPLCGLLDPALGADAHPLQGWPLAGATAAFGLGLAPSTLKILCVARTLGLVAFTLGVAGRIGALVAAASGALVLLQAPFGFTSTQYLLLQATFLLGLADSSAVLALRRAPPRSPTSSRWMLRAFVASIYVWAACAKLRPDWLDGRTLALFHQEGRLRGPLADLLLGTPRRAAAMGPAIAFGELALAPLLLLPRTRAVGLALAVAFHLGIEWMGHPDVIGWAMLCLLVVFVEGAPQRTQVADSRGQTTRP